MHQRFLLLAIPSFLLCAQIASAQAVDPSLRPSSLRINVQNDTPVNGDFTVAPTRFVLPMQPGEERTVEVQITNRKGSPATFDLFAEDFSADASNEGSPMFYARDIAGPFTARLWLEPEFDRIQLLHAERAFVRVTIKVPSNAEAGDHQAGIIVRREMEEKPTSGFGLESRVAALFIVSVAGDVVQEGSLVDIQARRFLNWWHPVFLRLEASNRGTVHMAPRGTVQIRNIFGILVDEIPVENWIILRASNRPRELQWSPSFALGRYTATTDLTVFDGQALNVVSTAFWVIPIVPILVILLVIFFVSFAVQYVGARFEIRRKD